MKSFYARFVVSTILLLSGTSMVNAQCGANTTSGAFCTRSSFYYGEILANQGCGSYTTVFPYSPGEYFRIPVLSGACYTIQTCGAGIDTQIGVFEGTATTGPFSYNDDNGSVCTGTAASVNFVPNFNNYARVDVRQYNCQSGGSSSITLRVRQNNNLNITSSAASMCQGQTRSLTATPTATTPFTAGAGNGGTFTGTGVSGTTFTAPTPAGASQTYTITYTFGYCSTSQAITVFRNPTTANAGPNQSIACGATTATLSANTPTYGTGVWTVVSGTGTVTNPTSPTSTVTGLTPGGSSTFRWTITNGPCTSSTDNVTISATNDVTAPVPNVGTLPNITAQCQVTSLTPPTATDNCSGTITGTTGASLPITSQGTTVITWTYNDGNGNTSSQTQNVVINDVTAPNPNVGTLPNITAQCQVTSLTPPTANDNCVGSVTGTTGTSLPITAQGTTVVTWTYNDGNGNTSTQTQNVIINDVNGPTPSVTPLPDVTSQCQVTSLTAPSATDNCGGAVTVSHNASLPITTQGTTVVTWTYTDVNGNSSTQTQNVVIDDTNPPVPNTATLSTVSAQCVVTSISPPTATDNCVGSVTGTTGTTFPITAQGTTVVTWSYDDGNGNVATQTQNVVINDATAPVPNAGTLADVTGQCQVSSLTAPTATDNCGGSVTVTNDATLPITAQGTTVVTWTYTDGNGNSSTQTQNVVIDDVTGPTPDVATLANVTAECQVTSLTSPTATDNCGGSVLVTNDATLPITAQGTTVVTWTYTDVNGNTSMQTQNVVINDVTAPTPDVATLTDVTAACQVTSLTAPTATDNCGGSVTVTNDATLPITAQGTTVVTWTYTDASGNSSTQTQNVVISDATPPTPDVATLADVTAECEVTALTAPTATDNCGGTVTVTNDATLPISTQGTTVVTWTYTDAAGNSSTQTQNVVINDVTAPTAVCQSITVFLDGAGNATIIAADIDGGSTDNCGPVSFSASTTSFTCADIGANTVTLTVDDGNGNTNTCTAIVTVSDTISPTPDVATLADVTAECEVTSLTAPTASDNCTGTVTVTNDATLPISSQGTTVVTWTYDDGNGNTSTQTQNVVIDDVTAPTPDVAALADVTAECEVTSLTAPTATDNCGGTVTVTNDATLPISAQGTTVVTWTYTDANGNTSTQTQNVVIDDVTAPTPDAATLADVTAECEVTSLTAPTATDNCGGTVTVTNDATLPISTQGTTVVTWTYTDVNGNSSTQTQNVVIDDVTAPTPDAAALADVTAECEVTSLTAPTATDNCSGTVTVTNDATLPISAQGTTVVTWTYTDVNGNSSTQTQNVVIDDVTAPTPDVATLADVTAECEVTSLTAPAATDNCGGTVTVTNDATLPISAQGTTVVTWTYTDVNGNSSTQTQNVVIDDVTAPTPDAAALAGVTSECEVTSLTAPTATDNCGGIVTVTNDATLPISTQGTTVVTWTYDDGNGNTSTQTQNVVIDDVTAPTPDVATLADVTAECEVTSLTAPTATDNCGGTVTVTNDATLPISTQGTTVVTWTYTDVNGNSSTQTQNVVIDDVTAPTPDVATLADVTAECEVTSLTAPTATDNCGGAVTVTNDATLPISTQGTTVVTWTYTDVNGNSSTQTQNVVIDDVTAPTPDVATLTDVTAECEVTSLTAPTATDNCGGTVTVTNDATLPISAQGTTVVTWTYTDVNGNSSTQTQNVVIDDVTAPTPDVAALADVTAECEVTSLTAPTATDNCGGTVTVTNDATLPISTQGTTVVTWTYDDGNGNTSTQTQNVVIDDVTAPTPDVATLADVTAECEVTSLTAPTATDNCGGAVTVTNDATLPISAQGTTVVTWTYTDVNGNSSTQTQNVVIDDVTAPTPDAAALADVTAECEVTSLTAPTATDNCGGTVTVTNDATLPISAQGTTVVTWTYTDVNGNSSTQMQDVVIDDVTAPTPDAAALADVTAECEVTSLTAPTATDNCGGTVTVTNDATLPISTQGTTVVTWTYDDGNGNTSTQTQNVVIDDATAPTPDVATLADVTAECEVTSLTAPTATDNCGGSVTVTNDATLPISTQGTTVVTWTYDDGNGNTSTQTQNVVIDDVTAPTPDVATLADVTAECEVTSLTAPTATDNCGGTVTVTNDATLPISTQGTTVVTWTYTDVNGNSSTQTQNVVIDDVTAPTPDAATLADVTAECEVTSLTDPTATDNCGGTVTVTNDATLPISAQGTTVVTWTYTDVNGNSSTQTQNVVIDDVTAPTPDAAALADVTAECEVTSLTAPTATDNCGGTVTVTNDATLPISVQGTTVVTWTYDDGNGNTSTQTQNLVIDDQTSPVPSSAPLPDVIGQCSVDVMPAPPSALDACVGSVVGVEVSGTTFPVTTQGTTILIWEFDDGNGNIASSTQNIIVNDVSGPVADNAVLPDLTGLCSIDAPASPTATDDCVGTVIGTTSTVFPITATGTTTVVWEYADGNGNVTSQVQDFIITGVDVSTELSFDGTTITALNSFGTYQWIDCETNAVVDGETNQSFSPSANGDYAVIVSEGGCTDTSACVTVSTVGIVSIDMEKLSVYPNPSIDGYFTINYDGTIESVQVLDMLGREIALPVNLITGEVDGSTLAHGRYMIRVKTEKGYALSEIVIAQ